MSEVIPNEKIESRKDKIKTPPETTCIRNDTTKWLCELKTWIFETSEEKAYEQIKELLQAQKYLQEKVSAENENEVLVILKSPDNKYHLVSLPKSFWEKQSVEVMVGGEKISLEAVPKTNGYNTEYFINKGNWDWKQIAILFTLINPEWKKQYEKIQSIQNRGRELMEKIRILKYEEKKTLEHSLKDSHQKAEKGKKKSKPINYKEKLLSIREEIKVATKEIREIDRALIIEKKNLWEIKKVIDFPYTPYNRQYNTPEMRMHGYAYIDHSTRDAFEKLSSEKSVVWWEKKLTLKDAFSHDIATTLNVVERMDYYSYFGKDGKTLKSESERADIMNGQINKALTTIALNQNGAFNWQRSKVWALGIGQFMPLTYENLKDKYQKVFPENLSFEQGAKDHSTSFRLQALHFNEESRAFPRWIKENWTKILSDPEARIWLYALIAAGYNGSITRVVKEANLWENFDTSLLQPDKLIARLSANKETQTYVIKFVYTWNHLKKNYREFWK